MRQAPDPARCPLCGAENRRALAAGRPDETCWCVTARFTPELLARIPTAARGKACICARRAAESQATGENGEVA